MRRLKVDLIIGLLVVSAAGAWATHYLRAASAAGRGFGPPDAEVAEPAVLVACGYGLHVTQTRPEALDRFLRHQDDRLSCAALPATLDLSPEPLTRGTWLYLLLTTAAAWRILGISWVGLAPMFGLFFGMTSGCVYVLLRLVMGRLLALAFVFAVSISPLNVLNLANLRDYARAPFMLALIAFALAVGLRRWTTRGLLLLSAGYGVVAGIGYGFRADVVIEIPLFVIAVLLFLEGPTTIPRPLLKIGALSVAALTFAVSIWPQSRYTAPSGGNLWHVALIGFMPEYGDALGVENPTYHWGVTGTDELIQLTVGDYARRLHPQWPPLSLATPQYDAATRSYYAEFFPRFPADMVTRVIASIVRIPELPFGWPQPPLNGVADRVYAVRGRLLAPLYGWGIVVVAGCLIAVALLRPRIGVFLLFVFAYVAGYPAIQYHNRHFFYLEVIGWMAIGFGITQLVHLIRGRRLFSNELTAPVMVRRLTIAAAFTLMAFAAWAGLRAAQQRMVRRSLSGYLRAAVEPLTLDRGDSNGQEDAVVRQYAGRNADLAWARYLRVELSSQRCDGGRVTFQYDRQSPYRSLSTTFTVPKFEVDERMVLFEPVFTSFASIRMADTRPGCLISASEVVGLNQEPLWLPLRLASRSLAANLFQTIRTRENIH